LELLRAQCAGQCKDAECGLEDDTDWPPGFLVHGRKHGWRREKVETQDKASLPGLKAVLIKLW
jgi:hypothetical protein